jgi:LDH2 family malate/lactate/ureidoglycolate dehydrogenase
MIAIDIARLMPLEAYYERIETLAAWLQASGDPGAVRLPGAQRWQARRENEVLGIALAPSTIGALVKLARELGIRPPASLTPLAEQAA